jgi:hypothetical protein
MSKRTAEEWGRIAVSLPGWRWMTGMQALPLPHPDLPDPDHPATEGWFLRLLGDRLESIDRMGNGWYRVAWFADWGGIRSTRGCEWVGRECIAAAEAMGRWPGGEG